MKKNNPYVKEISADDLKSLISDQNRIEALREYAKEESEFWADFCQKAQDAFLVNLRDIKKDEEK